MGRFFNREAAFVALALLAVGVASALYLDVPIWAKVVIPVAVLAILHWPVTIATQERILEAYTERGLYDRALALALDIRESSPDRKTRQRASLNVAFVHMARGDYENALKNLRTIVVATEQAVFKAVVDGATGYCLAQLDRDLPEAERLVLSSLRAQPEEAIFVSFLALVRLKQGNFAEARQFLEKSFALDPDPALPHPGERAYMMALALEGLGERAKSREQLKIAERAGCLFGRKAGERLRGLDASGEPPSPGMTLPPAPGGSGKASPPTGPTAPSPDSDRAAS